MAKTKKVEEGKEIDEGKLKNQVATLTEGVVELIVHDQPSFNIAGEYLIKLQTIRKTVVEYFKPLKAATYKAHKALTQREKDELTPIDDADRIVRQMRIAYNTEQEKKRKKEQDRLDAIAKRKADKEREKLLAKAEKAEDPEEKEELEQKAEDVYVPANIAAGGMEKTTTLEGGGSTTWVEDIEVEVTSLGVLLTEIVSNNIPSGVIEIKHSRLKAWVKANDIKNGQVKGITIRKTRRESVKGA